MTINLVNKNLEKNYIPYLSIEVNNEDEMKKNLKTTPVTYQDLVSNKMNAFECHYSTLSVERNHE